jgi:hypothetical protein
MYDRALVMNAVAAIRVSTTKQGYEGDSPEAQREQLDRFAINRSITIKKCFKFMESASKEEQPMQAAIDYCKDPKHDIQFFIVKSIDRLTRGGSYSYSELKRQLEQCGVRLVDIYGIIGLQKVNTLEHLGVSYGWSVYDPTKNSEILEAERASDEKRDIMSRMIGSQIRYARLGYWVRKAPFGYVDVRAETMHGRRSVLEPHPTEGKWVLKMFELRCRGTMNDKEIVNEINRMGYKSRVNFLRSTRNRTRIVARRGGSRLTVKAMQFMLKSTVYAGVNNEAWLIGTPIRCRFDGLVSIETFNLANRGKITIVEKDGGIAIEKTQTLLTRKRGLKTDQYPYRRTVTCPGCNQPLRGSASRGHSGKYYPAYHCDYRRDGRTADYHYFRVPKKKFEETVTEVTQLVYVLPQHIESLIDAVKTEWSKRQAETVRDTNMQRSQIAELKAQARMIADRIKFCSQTTIKYLEEDLVRVEQEIADCQEDFQEKKESRTTLDTAAIARYARYFAEHPASLLLDEENPERRADYFGLLFEQPPAYDKLIDMLHGVLPPELSEIFGLDASSTSVT